MISSFGLFCSGDEFTSFDGTLAFSLLPFFVICIHRLTCLIVSAHAWPTKNLVCIVIHHIDDRVVFK